ncbi:hypothetical protein QJS04_geneDACA005513 [Acorus gramineus]|uniref:Uncharacterized protein n=1 Tax=Acorus gramineus TaxID=55184 RepID=A0AAV9A5P9_ACOGR|nr:hypothetical protein QJS04_geneDACA005513 [Acorus gramineus]
MASNATALVALTCLLLLLPLHHALSNPKPLTSSAHDELRLHGFPVGLLPSAVRAYSLNRTSGDFSVDLGGPCQFNLPPDNYLASYSSSVTGTLADRRIARLEGIRVWAFFKWWSITGIRSDGGDLVFEVGVVSAKYASKNFDESPVCEGRSSSS